MTTMELLWEPRIVINLRIQNELTKNIKVASEDSGADAFLSLYKNNRDFCNFIMDPDRMQSLFVSEKYKFKGYREAKEALERIREEDTPTESDLRTVYRMFNYVIPSDGSGNAKKANDIAKQRGRFFNELNDSGYSAVLDTNDAIYGAFKANAPVIVFDMSSINFKDADTTSATDKRISTLAYVGMRALGL